MVSPYKPHLFQIRVNLLIPRRPDEYGSHDKCGDEMLNAFGLELFVAELIKQGPMQQREKDKEFWRVCFALHDDVWRESALFNRVAYVLLRGGIGVTVNELLVHCVDFVLMKLKIHIEIVTAEVAVGSNVDNVIGHVTA